MFWTKNIFLIVLFHLNILIFYWLYCVIEFFLFWVHSHIIIPKRALEVNWASCWVSWFIMPAIICRWYSNLFCAWLKYFFPKGLVHCRFHWAIKWLNISCSSLTVIYRLILSQRWHKMQHSWIILPGNVSKKWHIPTLLEMIYLLKTFYFLKSVKFILLF